MPLRQEDDVARLLRESGTNGASYRSFDNATVVKNDASALPIDSQITPLINEIFGKSHTVQSPAESAGRLLAVVDGLGVSSSGGFFDQHGAPLPW